MKAQRYPRNGDRVAVLQHPQFGCGSVVGGGDGFYEVDFGLGGKRKFQANELVIVS